MSKAATIYTTDMPPPGFSVPGDAGRRAVLAGSAAVAALSSGVAFPPSPPPPNPDVELIGLCAAFDVLERRIDALFDGVSALDFEAADAAACVIEVGQRRVLDRICALSPSTDEGCCALARSLALLSPDYADPSWPAAPTMNERLANVLVRGMMGRVSA